MFKYYNANPLGRHVNDCTVRAISLATGRSWDSTYRELSTYAQALAIMPDDVQYIDDYLERNFEKIYYCSQNCKVLVGDFIASQSKGIYLIILFVLFIIYTFIISKEVQKDEEKNENIEVNQSTLKSIFYIALGIIGLRIGGDLTVNNAVKIAETLNLI